jgi:16S rRNA (guanine527-N7)-methyltransferase
VDTNYMTAVDQANDTLSAALARYQIELPGEQAELLDRYCRLLWDWNEKLNLTRHTTYEKFVARDVIDSLAFSQFLTAGEDVLDVGTGGGVPGIVVAIVRPDVSVSLCDSVAKKARVVGQIVQALGLNLPVHNAKAQDLLEDGLHDTLMARAVAPLPKLLTWLDGRWSLFRRLLVLKGPAWVEERHAAREQGLMNELQLRKLLTYPLAGTDAESVLLEIRPKSS